MSDAVIITVIGFFSLVVSQVAMIVIAWRRAKRSDERAVKFGVKLDEIDHQTNSNLTEQRAEIKALHDEVRSLNREKGEAEGKAEAKEEIKEQL